MFIVTEKIVREHTELKLGEPGQPTPGAMINEMLTDMAFKGEECHKIELQFEPEMWFQFAAAVRNQAGELNEAIRDNGHEAPRAKSLKR